MSNPNQVSVSESDENLKAALERIAKSTAPPNEGSLAAAVKRIAEGQNARSNSALKAALERIAKSTAPPNEGGLAAAVKRIAEGQNASRRPALRETLGRVGETQGSMPVEDPSAAIRKWSHAYRSAAPKPCPRFSGALGGISRAMQAGAGSRAIGFRDGLSRSMQLNLNPQIGHRDLLGMSAYQALEGDWKRVETDLWASIEKVARQLDMLPEPAQARFRSALIHYLRSGGST